jgi:hypothetical protein
MMFHMPEAVIPALEIIKLDDLVIHFEVVFKGYSPK